MFQLYPEQGAGGVSGVARILIMAALPLEVRPFLRRVGAQPRQGWGAPAWEWAAGAGVVGLSGMGADAARRAGETLVAHCRPTILASVGFGGALVPGLAVGNLVLGEAFRYYDPEARELKEVLPPPPPRPLALVHRTLKAAGWPAAGGTLVSTSRIIHKKSEGDPIAGLPAPVLDLETSALAEVAAAQGLPFLSLRAITDPAGEEIPEFLRQAGDREPRVRAGAVLSWLAADPRRVKDLLTLWGRSRRAAQALAGALLALWPLLLAAGGKLEKEPD